MIVLNNYNSREIFLSHQCEFASGVWILTLNISYIFKHHELEIPSTTFDPPICRNPSFGLTTKAKGLQGCGPRGSPGVTSHTPGSVRKCEGMNLHTPKATPTLGNGVPIVATLALGLRPRQRGCKGTGQEEPSHSQGNSHFGKWSPGGFPKLQRAISKVKTQ
jgi:hypothetical protein